MKAFLEIWDVGLGQEAHNPYIPSDFYDRRFMGNVLRQFATNWHYLACNESSTPPHAFQPNTGATWLSKKVVC